MPSTNRSLRGEVWEVNFAPSVGAEIQKIRPAVVMNVTGVGRLPLSIVVPITNWRTEYEELAWFVPLSPSKANGLSKASGADAFQVKSVSLNRFVQRIGALNAGQIEDITDAIAVCVGMRRSL